MTEKMGKDVIVEMLDNAYEECGHDLSDEKLLGVIVGLPREYSVWIRLWLLSKRTEGIGNAQNDCIQNIFIELRKGNTKDWRGAYLLDRRLRS